jgi:hypothetical protein
MPSRLESVVGSYSGDAVWWPHRQWQGRSLAPLVPERGDGNVAVDWMAQVQP